ncbi:2663_t:CDS:2 [Rhizophagus irregularis]|nr:2663_t:CDS:2 [Rhizophagus irregularis]
MSSKFCSEEQLLTIKKINRDQSRIIDSKQAIIEDQARLINTQQQLIDMIHGSEHSIENVSSNDLEHEDRYENNGDSEHNGYRVLLRNIKNSISLKMVKNQLERAYGPIYDIEPDQQNKSLAYAYFENLQHSSKALEDGRIKVDAVNVIISSK